MAFSNLLSSELFSEIKIAVVDNAEYRENSNFQEALSSISTDSEELNQENPDHVKLFNVTYTSKEEADNLLKDDKIKGYIHFDNGIKLIVKKSKGLSQTIIKGFLDDYKQTTSTVYRIISEDLSAIQKGLIDDVSTE